MSNPGVVRIFRIKNAVPVAALPAARNKDLEETLLKVMPEFELAPNTLYTSFNNIGAVFSSCHNCLERRLGGNDVRKV